jgi:predicted nucleotidyltransferase
MTSSEPESFARALRSVAAFLNELPSHAMLIGGLAVIAHGYIRTTDDIDATVSGEGVSVGQLVVLAAGHDLRPRIQDAVAFAQRTQVLLLMHEPTGVRLDLSLAWLPFEHEALTRMTLVRLGDVELRVCSPEDLIVYKLVAARPKDLDDVYQVALRHRNQIDRTRIAGTLRDFDEGCASAFTGRRNDGHRLSIGTGGMGSAGLNPKTAP